MTGCVTFYFVDGALGLTRFRSILSSVFVLEEIVGHLAVMRIPGEVEERASPDKMF